MLSPPLGPQAPPLVRRDAAHRTLEHMLARGLTDSAAWLGEMVDAAAPADLDEPLPDGHAPPPAVVHPPSGLLAHARALFSRQEFQRCRGVLADRGDAFSVFLREYAHYLDGDRQKALATGAMAPHPAGAGLPVHEAPAPPSDAPAQTQRNPHAAAVHACLVQLLSPAVRGTDGELTGDPYLWWLLGLSAKEAGEPLATARRYLATALRLEPLLWAAWCDMCTAVESEADAEEVVAAVQPGAPFPWAADCFAAKVRLELQQHDAALAAYEALQVDFPASPYVTAQRASCEYERRNMSAARQLFAAVHSACPGRLEGMHEYSNVLFVLRDRLSLSALAQECHAVDPFRAETNCVLGNYYTLLHEHQRSLVYFRRAVQIDPRCLTAWTLLGHAYVEARNCSAAVEAYRSAIAVDRRDYRAWYGLGQLYELLHMPHYALHYYWHATNTRPGDARMWIAVADALEKQRRSHEAVACLERAALCEGPQTELYPTLCTRLAEAAARTNPAKAAAFFQRTLEAPQHSPGQAIAALSFLARHNLGLAKELVAPPARAPSFEPGMAAAGECLRRVPRPSAEQRRSLADQYLGESEMLLAQLQSLPGAEAGDLARELEYLQQHVASAAP